jgi:hypothetical protein
VLFGTPPFDDVKVERRNLRLQLEHEAFGKLLKLRQGVLASGGDAKANTDLLAASLSTIMVIFRAVERLNEAVPPTDYERLSHDVARRAGFDAEPFVRVVRHVRGTEKIGSSDASTVLAGYLGGMTELVSYLDRYEPEPCPAPRGESRVCSCLRRRTRYADEDDLGRRTAGARHRVRARLDVSPPRRAYWLRQRR